MEDSASSHVRHHVLGGGSRGFVGEKLVRDYETQPRKFGTARTLQDDP
jgi:hypothetical protein